MGIKKRSPRKCFAHESGRRWAGYAKAAGLGAFALGVAGDADAAIVRHGATHNGSPLVLGAMINPPTLAYQNSFDLDGDGINDFFLGSGNYGSAFGYDNGQGGTIFTSGNPAYYAEAFAPGATIDGTASPAGNFFSVEVLNPSTTFGAGQTGLMGFQTSLGYFGWMSLTLTDVGDQGFNGVNDLKITINDMQYDNTGAGIGAGVPEPSSLALLAAGSIGLLARRRRINAA